MEFDTLKYDNPKGGIGLITLNRPNPDEPESKRKLITKTRKSERTNFVFSIFCYFVVNIFPQNAEI